MNVSRPPRGTWFAAALLALALTAWIAGLVGARHSFIGMVPATGVVATLADAILRGQAPGHEDGSVFLATFYLPPYPMLVAALVWPSVDYIHGVPGPLVWIGALRTGSVLSSALLMLASAWAAAGLVRGSRGAPADRTWRIALLAPAMIAVTYMFKASSLGGRADPLAAAFALAALGSWLRDEELKSWRTPALAAAAFLTKATSLAVPIGIALWSLERRRAGPLMRFVARLAICLAIALLFTIGVHWPTWYANALHGLIFATPSTSSWLRGPAEIVRYLGACGELAVFGIFAASWLAREGARARPVVFYFAAVVLIAAATMTNFGAGPNHLDELAAATATIAAAWAAPRLARPAFVPAFALAIAVAGASWRDITAPLRASNAPDNLRTEILAVIRAEPGEVLTEDALLSLAAGRRPFVSDPGALRSMSLKGDPRALRIVEGIRRQRFALIVLDDDLEGSARWYHNIHLGDLVTSAIRERYRPAGIVNRRFLWRPRV